MSNPYATGLDKNAANFVPLSPIGFLRRTAAIYPQRTAIVHGERRYTWRETQARCRRLASALATHGIGRGDTVAVMAPNVPEAFEAHFGVPMAGAVLNMLNIRLDAETIAFILKHGDAKVLITDTEFAPVIKAALGAARRQAAGDRHRRPRRVRRRAPRRHRLRGLHRRRRPRFRRRHAARRMGRDRAQLHLGHHRQPEGRRLSPSRRLSERARQHPRLGHAAAPGLSVDLADVPLQRLVLPVDGDGARRDACLPAPGRGRRRSTMRSSATASPICAARRW